MKMTLAECKACGSEYNYFGKHTGFCSTECYYTSKSKKEVKKLMHARNTRPLGNNKEWESIYDVDAKVRTHECLVYGERRGNRRIWH